MIGEIIFVGAVTRHLTKRINMEDYTKQYKLAKKCVKKLKKAGLRLATAESITGGMIADSIVSVSGASEVYEEGYITYSDFAKMKNLFVDPSIIEQEGVVSKAVASAMAKGTLYEADSDYALATTGCAGPKSDEYGTKVGDVFVACASKKEVIIRKYHFRGNRNKVRCRTTVAALKLLLEMLKNDI